MFSGAGSETCRGHDLWERLIHKSAQLRAALEDGLDSPCGALAMRGDRFGLEILELTSVDIGHPVQEGAPTPVMPIVRT